MKNKRFTACLVAAVFLVSVSACAKRQQVKPVTKPPVEEVKAPVQTTPPPPKEPEVKPVKMPVLQDVFFAFDKYNITDESKRILEGNAKQLKDAPSVDITIEGHCDERGTEAYNLALGERRAKAARDYLASLGVGGKRMSIISYGEERPFDTGHNETAWAKNRRAHFVTKSQ